MKWISEMIDAFFEPFVYLFPLFAILLGIGGFAWWWQNRNKPPQKPKLTLDIRPDEPYK